MGDHLRGEIMIRYCIYARVSSKQQAASDKVSIEDQLKDCHAWAASLGLSKAAQTEYVDRGKKSETLEGRPVFVQMLRDGIDGKFDLLIVRYGDRISRKVNISSAVYEDLTKAGVQIRDLSKDTSAPETPESFKTRGTRGNMGGLIQNTLTALMAEIDQSQRVERGITAKRNYTRQGRFMYQKPPFGYYLELRPVPGRASVEKIAIPDPKTYHLIESLPQLVLDEHLSDRDIAERWNLSGYRQRTGNPFTATTVYRIRCNPFYYGFVTYGRLRKSGYEEGPHSFARPWTKTQFDAMRDTKTTRAKSGGRRTGAPNPFAGTLRCGYCGRSMISDGGYLTNRGYRMQQVMCSSYRDTRTECRPNRWGLQPVWRSVIEELDEVLGEIAHSDTVPEKYLHSTDSTEKLTGLQKQLEAERTELAAIEPRRKRVNLAFQKEITDLEQYQQQIKELEEDRQALTTRISALQTELSAATDTATRSELLRTLAESWPATKLDLATKGTINAWDKATVQQVKFSLIQALFTRIEIKEPEGGSPRNASNQKQAIELVFVYR
jgi:DNA invertase Pin-like site-specific DNA recombinase